MIKRHGIFYFYLLWFAALVHPPLLRAAAILSWNSVTQNTAGGSVGAPIYYYVYRDTFPSFQPGDATFLVATTDTFILDTAGRLDDPAKNLFYRVKAVDAWGNESVYAPTTGEAPFVLTGVHIWLGAAYQADADSMVCALKNLDLLPFLSPYPESPRHVPVFAEPPVDWLLVQLLRPGDLRVAGEKSFLLQSNGTVTELDGKNSVLGIPGAEPGLYHIRIRHRNHLAATTHRALALNADSAVEVDFRADSSLYAAPESACRLGPEAWGLWPGDLDQDGAIAVKDYVLWRAQAQSDAMGYQCADLNFDGRVTTRDYVIWYRNARRTAL
ncbi:hypothetical protein GX408_14700 [bacterium]|nr:hypothetical protein [bacterium]